MILRTAASVLHRMRRVLGQAGIWLWRALLWFGHRPTRSRNAFSWLALGLTLFAIWATSAEPFVERSITATFVFEDGNGFQALNASGDVLFTKTFDGRILRNDNGTLLELLDVNEDMQQDVVVGVGSGAEGGQLLAYRTAFHWVRGTDGVLINSYGVTGGAIRFLIKGSFEGIGPALFVVGWDPNLDPQTCERDSATAGVPVGTLRFVSASEPPPTPNQGFDWIAVLDRKLNAVWERTFCSRYLSVANVSPVDEDGNRKVDYFKIEDTAGHEYHVFANGNWRLVKRSSVPIDPAYFGPKQDK